jgi:hypothetical protein
MPEQRNEGPLDPFLEKVLSDEDRVLFKEAAKAARVAAPRAAYLMIWLSCAESLKRKFREMTPRDGEAARISGEIAGKETNHKAVDKYLLQKAKEYGLVTDLEFTQLDHIYTMRCIYAHPYEEQPTLEQLIAAAQSVVDSVLGRPTKLRHGYLSEQVRLLTEELSFLDDVRSPVEHYAEQVQARADDELHLWFLRKLWEKLEAMASDHSMVALLRRGVWFSAAYLKQVPEVFDEWDVVADLVRTPAVLSLVLSEETLYVLVSDHAKGIVIGTLLERGASDSRYLDPVGYLIVAGVLGDGQLERVGTAIREMSLDDLVSMGVHPACYVDVLVEELKSHNWYRQKDAMVTLENAGPGRLGYLSVDTQHILGNNVLQAAEGDCGQAKRFLRDVSYSQQDTWPEQFVEGVLAECFVNDDDEIRFKTRCLNEALRFLGTLSPLSRESVIGRLVHRVQGGEWKGGSGWRHSEAKEKALQIMENAIEFDETRLGMLRPLIEIIKDLETEDYGETL